MSTRPTGNTIMILTSMSALGLTIALLASPVKGTRPAVSRPLPAPLLHAAQQQFQSNEDRLKQQLHDDLIRVTDSLERLRRRCVLQQVVRSVMNANIQRESSLAMRQQAALAGLNRVLPRLNDSELKSRLTGEADAPNLGQLRKTVYFGLQKQPLPTVEGLMKGLSMREHSTLTTERCRMLVAFLGERESGSSFGFDQLDAATRSRCLDQIRYARWNLADRLKGLVEEKDRIDVNEAARFGVHFNHGPLIAAAARANSQTGRDHLRKRLKSWPAEGLGALPPGLSTSELKFVLQLAMDEGWIARDSLDQVASKQMDRLLVRMPSVEKSRFEQEIRKSVQMDSIDFLCALTDRERVELALQKLGR